MGKTPKKTSAIVKADHRKLNQLVKAMKTENRILDTVVGASPSTTATVTNMTLISQGDDLGQREGNKIVIKKIDIRYGLTLAPGVSTPSCIVRVMYLYWHDGLAGVLPTISTILSAGTNVLSDLNYLFKTNFTVLYDKLHSVSAVESNGITVRKSIKCSKVATYYATASGNYDKGQIIQVVMSDQTSLQPAFTSYTRVEYLP